MDHSTSSEIGESSIFDGSSYEPSDSCEFTLEGWDAAMEHENLSGINTSSPTDVASPGSEISSQWTDGKFAQVEKDIEQHSGIMSDYEGRPPSSIPCQSYVTDGPPLDVLSPEWLSCGMPTPTSSTVPTEAGATDVPTSDSRSNVQPQRFVFAKKSSTKSRLLPSATLPSVRIERLPNTAPDGPRRGRGRKKLPEDKLKKNQRRKMLPEKCMFCDKGFPWKRDRKRHLKTCHQKDALDHGYIDEEYIKMIPCDYCDKTFARRDFLKRHLKNKHAWCA